MDVYQPSHLDGRTVVVLRASWLGYRILESGELSHDGKELTLVGDQWQRPFCDFEAESLKLVTASNRIPQCQGFDFFLIDKSASSPTPPRRFRFGLRSLFVLVVSIAIPCAWVAYSLNWIQERHAMLDNPIPTIGGYRVPKLKPPLRAPAGLWIFGEQGVRELWVFNIDLERARKLFPEAAVIPVTIR